MSSMFEPLTLGAVTLKNRVVMSPLTRSRSGDDRIPNEMMAEYYAQRAGAGLIISEATSVTPMGVGYAATPGIWNKEQADAWSHVTKAVHDRDGKIVLQLWHVGRISDPEFLDGKAPVAPSAIAAEGHVSLLRPMRPYPTPRALETDEVVEVVEAYRNAAKLAKDAGFDGVELHAANGYLIDQFLQDSTNKRSDRYGGSMENRARLLMEITDAVSEVWGPDRVGVHLSPRTDAHDMGDTDPKTLFTYVADQLKQRKIAFICLREYVAEDSLMGDIRAAFGGPVIANEGLTKELADTLLAEDKADAVAFGRDYIATPDLAERFRDGLPLNEHNSATFYAGGAEGYTDYPVHTGVAAE
ncbi:alkene reductase [Paracoccus sp. JM45]|uniref:alkene reductase n=1 Tax=Paracoccus sp. JM45 TaxID=2283626 RepID=UPI000E6C46C5|nr:alkene reductase [Paracoccus sp. JM45]RJE79751.1 alkene reductase [Paracoccus sp. JM45]